MSISYLKTIMVVFLYLLASPGGAADDVAGFAIYEQSNAELKDSPADPSRVVFIGNSITYYWMDGRPGFFTDNDFIGRGIGGQTTYQFLMRFREDVVALNPAAVVINGATNDVADMMYPFNIDRTFGNIVSMVEISQANGIQVILTSVLPAACFYWNSSVTDAPGRITALNRRIEEYALLNDIPYVDYYPELVSGSDRALNPNFTEDGVHPNGGGYEVMESLLYPVIRQYVDYDSRLPEKLYLLQNGAPTEREVEFTMTSVGHFIAFSEFAAGDSYRIIDEDDNSYFINDGAVTQEQSEGAIPEDGVYCIELDFITGKASVAAVKSLSVYHSANDAAVAELDYQGDGQWSGIWQCSLEGEEGGTDGRYRFVMETEDGTRTFGTPKADGETEPTLQDEPTFHRMKKVCPANPYDNTWTLPEYLDQTPVLIRVNLRGDFLHFINAIVSSIDETSAESDEGKLVMQSGGGTLIANYKGVVIYGLDGRLKARLDYGEPVLLPAGIYIAVKDGCSQTIVVG